MEGRDNRKRSPRGLIRNYVMGLIKHTATKAVLVIDFVGFILAAALDVPVPQWFYWLVAVGGFLWANFSLYAEETQKAVELEEELAQIREREPSLRLYLVEQDDLRADLSVIVPMYPEEPDIEVLVSQRAEELEYRRPEPKRSSLAEMASLARSLMMVQPTAKQLERYRERVNEHLEEYRTYLEDQYSYDYLICRSRQIQLAVTNKGKIPANSVVVRSFFPEEVEVAEASEFREEPEEPEKPRGIWDFGLGLRHISSLLDTYPWLRDIELRGTELNVTGPTIEADRATRVTYEIRKVMHNLPEKSLDPLVLVFPADRSDTVCEIPYEIHCDELAEPERGALKINVRYEKEEQQQG